MSLSTQTSAESFEEILKRGKVRCGYLHFENVDPDLANGFKDFSEDLCRAFSLAAFQKENYQFFEFTNQDKIQQALLEETIDIILPTAPIKLNKVDFRKNTRFITAIFFNPNLFIVKRDSIIKTHLHLEGKKICYTDNGDLVYRIKELAKQMSFEPLLTAYTTAHDLEKDFSNDTCDVMATNYIHYMTLLKNPKFTPSSHERSLITFLKPYISIQPMQPLIKAGHDNSYDFFQWVIWGLIEAEEKNINQTNILKLRYSEDPSIQRLLGNVKGIGVVLNLPDRWLYSVVEKVGNYGEIFSRHLGKKSAYREKRSLNQLWTRGGLIYAIPVR